MSDEKSINILGYYDALKQTETRWIEEDNLFKTSGICVAKNQSYNEKCTSRVTVDDLYVLRHARCFCDDECHKYRDCCINYGLKEYIYDSPWTCREIRVDNTIKIPLYLFQKCPSEWKDSYTQTMCEIESSYLEKEGKQFSYLQDIPVKSEVTGIFYRNAFCAYCNNEHNLVKWKSYFDCSDVPKNLHRTEYENLLDFSSSVYNTRTQNFRRVKFGEKFTNCKISFESFRHLRILHEYNGRFCKPVVDTCGSNSDEISKRKCKSYASFVYESKYSFDRKVYKNFHCALCNNVNTAKLTCLDPYFPPIFGGSEETYVPHPSLAFLLDFNFEGGNNKLGFLSSCKLRDGLVWDPVLKVCSQFTCGHLFERKDSKCVPRITGNSTTGLNDSCPKIIMYQDKFKILQNGSAFLNNTEKYLSQSNYEIYEKEGNEIISIAICADEGSFLLNLSNIQYWFSEITLILSIICLILHLGVYIILKDLRNCPGMVLMSLSSCLLSGHIFLLIGPHVRHIYWMCYLCGVLMHFGYLSSFLWMNVMAYDIYRTFSEAHCRNIMKKKTYLKYSLYCWITSLVVTTFSVCFDNLISTQNEFRPQYGFPICWFNQRKGLLVFFVLPIFILLMENVIFFTIAAFHIRTVSKQTKMVNNFSDKVRYFLYVKLSVVFGLTWLLGGIAGILRVGFLWYPFLILNGLQGVFIFIAFTVKRKIIKMLLIKFKIRSDSYKMGKQSGFKRVMYSSLSNLSTLQTTLTAHLPALEENPEILKAVRKINPDAIVENKKV